MKAIFNRNCVLVGWYEPQSKNVFSKEMVWIGFINDGYFFSETAQWLGGFINGTYVDKQGKPIAWIEGSIPMGVNALILPMRPIPPLRPLPPIPPLRPLPPIPPLRPLLPFGGWSSLDWNKYIRS